MAGAKKAVKEKSTRKKPINKTTATDARKTSKQASSGATPSKMVAKQVADKKPASGKSKTKIFIQTQSGTAALQKPDPEHRRCMIAETSYFIAERRGFASGSPVDDWLEAELLVDRLLETGEGGNGTSTLSPE